MVSVCIEKAAEPIIAPCCTTGLSERELKRKHVEGFAVRRVLRDIGIHILVADYAGDVEEMNLSSLRMHG